MCCGLLDYLRVKGESKSQMVLKKGTLALYKVFFIIQGQKYIKIDTFISVFIFPYFILNTIAFESKGHGFGLGRLWVKCIP